MFLVKAKIIVCASRLSSSFRHFVSRFLVQKSKEQFFVPELGALFLVQKSDENSSLFRRYASMFLVKSKDHTVRFAPRFLVPTLRVHVLG